MSAIEIDPLKPLGRRTLLASAAALAATTAPGRALAQQAPAAAATPRVKGPLVWRDMDQAELDAAYDQSQYAPNLRQVLSRFASVSEGMRERLGAPRRVSYGSSAIEAADVYVTGKPDAPINIFLHGGAWRNGLAKDYAFPAELFAHAGAHLVVPDFAWVQDVDGDLTRMAGQLKRMLTWVYRNATAFGGDPKRIFVSGHSSGAHLASVLLTTDWSGEFELPANVVKGALCCSGVFDLKAVRLSARSSYVKFTDEMEQAMSSRRHLDKINTPVIVAYGSLETPEYQRQARDFAAALRAAGKQVVLHAGQNYNHFEVIETLANPYGLLGRAVLRQMQLV